VKEILVSHVTDDTDILEQTATAYEPDEAQALPFVLPPSRRGGFRLFARLRGWLTPGRKQRALRARQGPLVARKFELPLDMLAQQHPDIYIRVMTGVG
jgi:hypothetical protein